MLPVSIAPVVIFNASLVHIPLLHVVDVHFNCTVNLLLFDVS
jgi:hypothetical protein